MVYKSRDDQRIDYLCSTKRICDLLLTILASMKSQDEWDIWGASRKEKHKKFKKELFL